MGAWCSLRVGVRTYRGMCTCTNTLFRRAEGLELPSRAVGERGATVGPIAVWGTAAGSDGYPTTGCRTLKYITDMSFQHPVASISIAGSPSRGLHDVDQ